jgi:hypothetical protein
MPTSVTGIEVQADACAALVESVALTGIVYKGGHPVVGHVAAVRADKAVNPLFMTFRYNAAPV